MKKLGVWLLVSCIAFACREKKESITPQNSALTVAVYATVKIVPEDYYLVYPSTGGILEEWFVDVGDSVLNNQLLAQIQNDNSELHFESVEINNQLALEKYKGKANLLQTIKNQIDVAQKQLTLDSTNFIRLKNLQEKNIGSSTEYEAAELKFELSANNLNSLKQQLSQTAIELESAYLQSQKQLKIALSQLGDYGVKSIMNGKVFDIKASKGELVNIQQPIAAIGSLNKFKIDMWIDEIDISKIRLGQDVFITLDAFPNEQILAKISKIYPEKNKGNQSFKVEGEFVEQPKNLLSGLSGEANIVIKTIKNTWVIPQKFLATDSTVLTPAGSVLVELGEKSFSHVEILSGLDSSSVIIDPSQDE